MKVGDKWIEYGSNPHIFTIIERAGKLRWAWVTHSGVVNSIVIPPRELSGNIIWGRRYINFNDYYEKVQTEFKD